jgi:uncharacterized protein YndB with AHSA1/START domain
MIEVNTHIFIERPPEAVWAVMTDPYHFAYFDETFLRAEYLQGAPGEIGSITRLFFRDNSRDGEAWVDQRILERREPYYMESELYSEESLGRGELELREEDGGTMVQYHISFFPAVESPQETGTTSSAEQGGEDELAEEDYQAAIEVMSQALDPRWSGTETTGGDPNDPGRAIERTLKAHFGEAFELTNDEAENLALLTTLYEMTAEELARYNLQGFEGNVAQFFQHIEQATQKQVDRQLERLKSYLEAEAGE